MDDEIKGEGNSVNFKYRMHDPRVGRFFAVDPLIHDYPWLSSYQFSGNRVIDAVELEGLETYLVHGTIFDRDDDYTPSNYFSSLYRDFGKERTGINDYYTPDWGGAYSAEARKQGGRELADLIISTNKNQYKNPPFAESGKAPILVLGHSHGGNVSIDAVNKVVEHYLDELDKGNISEIPRIDLILINTPTREHLLGDSKHSLSKEARQYVNFIQVDSKGDVVSGSDSGSVFEFYDGAYRIEYDDTDSDGNLFLRLGNHTGNSSENALKIIPKLKDALKDIETFKSLMGNIQQNTDNNESGGNNGG